MAMWYRVGSSRLRPVTHLLYTRLSDMPATFPSPSAVNSSKLPPVYAAPNLAFIQLRSFAAPVLPKSKQKSSEGSSAGPRVNGAITAPVVRLVTEDGHTVVSLKEALNRAVRLDLDLVEVQKTANPPVCKIMDFHKEKYKKEIMEKERAKAKSALSLKSGEKKEVRFKAKTELNDLKVKADGITRLIERGYRVKCTALPSGTQEEDLGEHLSRLLALMKDVSYVESGPHVDSKHAYAIVRHVKFETKKSGKKPNKIADSPKTSPTPESANEVEEEWECDSESDDVTSSNSKPEEISKTPLMGFEKLKEIDQRPVLDPVNKEQPPKKTEMNRYASRTEPQKNTRPSQPIAPNNYRDYKSRENSFNQGRIAPNNSRDFNRGDSFNQEPIAPNNSRDRNSRDAFNQGRGQFPNRGVQFQPSNQTLRPPNLGNFRKEGSPPPVANNLSNNPKFGIFNSSTKPADSSEMNSSSDYGSLMPKFNSRDAFNQGHITPNNSRDNNSRDSFNQGQGQFHNRGVQFQPSTQNFRPPNLGNFRKEGPPPVANNLSNNPNSPQKSFGAFSIPKTNATENTDAPPGPKFGIFNSSTKSANSSENDG